MRTTNTAPWAPLVSGATAAEARRAITAIAEALSPEAGGELHAPSSEAVDLSRGCAGLALFFGYLSRAVPDGGYREMAESWLDRAVAGVAEVRMSPALLGGFTGVAWVLEHLGELWCEEEARGNGWPDDDLNAEIDEALASMLETSPWGAQYDLIGGLAGYGVYLLERLPRPGAAEALEQVVRRLAEISEDTGSGRTWHTAPELLPGWQRELTPEGYYNLGAAHGVPAVAGLLAAAGRAGVATEIVNPLLAETVRWLLAVRRAPAAPSAYPSWIPKGERGDVEESRLAWCYGDAGAVACLYAAARAVGRGGWEAEARAMARDAARRRLADSGVHDCGLCHGAAGLLQVFNRLYQTSGDPQLARAARYWLEVTLAMREPGRWLGGFWSLEPPDLTADRLTGLVKTGSPGFLTGVAGVGLALLGAIGDVPPEWDRCLMVSLRQP